MSFFSNLFGKKDTQDRWAGHTGTTNNSCHMQTKAFHSNHNIELPTDLFDRDEVKEICKDIQIKTINILVIYGMGGVGKSTMLTKICREVECDKTAYFDLKNKDSFISIAKAILREVFFKSVLSDDEDDLISLLIDCLSKEKSLIVFDNMESIMGIGENSGNINTEFAGYDKMLKRILEESSKSTIIVSGREKLELGHRYDSKYKLWKLNGINVEQAKKMLRSFDLNGTESEWIRFVETYSGNSLTLKIVASEIKYSFNKEIAAFLNAPNMPHELLTLLNEQFDRFSDIEKTVLLISAIERESLNAMELWTKLVGVITVPSLNKHISNIVDHCFFETLKDKNKFYLQPVIMEFLTQKLIDYFVDEIQNEKVCFIAKIPLIDTFAKEYILDIQKENIVFPLRDILLRNGESRCFDLLMALTRKVDNTRSYAIGNIITLISSFYSEITDCDFSSKYILNADLRNIKLKNCSFRDASFESVLMLNTFGNLIDVKYSYDNNFIIGGATDFSFNAWDCKDMSYEFKFSDHTDWVRSVDSNRQLYASASNDESICVYDSQNMNLIAKFEAESRVRKVALFPDSNQYVLSAGDDGYVRLWNVLTSECIKFVGHNPNKVVWDIEIVYFESSYKVISVSDDKSVIMWNLDGTVNKILQTMESEIKSVASDNNNLVFWGCDDGTIVAFALNEMKVIATLNGHTGIVWGLDYDSVCQKLVSAASDKHVIIWDCRTEDIKKVKVIEAHNSAIWSANYNQEGTRFVTTGDDSEFKVWDAIDYKLLYCIKGYTNLLRNIHISTERHSLFVAGDDMIIREYSLDDLNIPRMRYVAHSNRVRQTDVSPNGRLLLSCGDDGNVIVWDTERKKRTVYKGHSKRVWTVAFISNEEFVSAGEENDIYLWHVNSIHPQRRITGHTNWIWDLSFFPDENMLISSSEDNSCILWNMDTKEKIDVFNNHNKWLFAASFSPSGKHFATASADNTSIIYDIISREPICVLNGHKGWVWSVIFIDENTVVTGGQDSKIIIWKIDYENRCYTEMKILSKHNSWVVSLAYDSLSHLLYSASADETIKVWDAHDFSYVKDVLIDKPYDGCDISGVKRLTESEKESLLHLGAIE